ncbi:hypothetical protein Nocox_32730 [Nonomuraea coxensis DSM 45129]|uniref:HEAT repeat protein n=1 Tax=Nonomuraea coxensis DSM 45129 TaxID=1122611 RepID=A0ABX8U8K7_9ACTN|nr:hypothetical protein [Nonomuraea coxensis]QYC44117.1 hypothetical protein Nocox_32730 [Nonomuraea coxensis DSM 45129]
MTEESPGQELLDAEPEDLSAAGQTPSLAERIEQEQKERRLRAEIIDVGQSWYGGSSYTAERGAALYGAGRDLIQYFGAEEEAVHTQPLSAAELAEIRACLLTTPSQHELAAHLASAPVVLLRGESHSGRWTAAVCALLEHGLTCSHLVARDPKKIRARDLRPGHGYVMRVDDVSWPRHPQAVIDQLSAVARESGAAIVALVPGSCAVTKCVVTHVAPAAGDIVRQWLAHLVPGIEPQLDDLREALDEHVVGCRPWQAVNTAVQLSDGLRRGRRLADMIADLPYTALAGLPESLKQSEPALSRHFLISSAVLYGLPEAIVSEAALALAYRIRQDEQRDPADEEEQGLPVWERLSEWIEHPTLDATRTHRGGEGQRIELRPGMADRLLTTIWEQLPGVRPALYDWLTDLVADDDWRVQLKAAHAVGKLATSDFDVIDKRFFTPWSEDAGQAKVLAWAVESAALADADVAALVRRRLKTWTTGSYAQRISAALAYGSSVGVRHVKEALEALHTVAAGAVWWETCDGVARSVAEIYTSETAAKVLGALARWVGGEHPGERLSAALAFVRLATAEQEDESHPPLWRHEPVSDLGLLWFNALDLGLSATHGRRRFRPYTPSAWTLMARWAERAASEPVIGAVVHEVIRRTTVRVRPSWLFHLHLWHRRGSITADQFTHYLRLVKEGRSCP